MAEIEIKRIHKIYGSGNGATPVLRGVNFSVEHGEFLAVTGPSGSGKSTLMNLLGLLDVPTNGEYILDDIDTASLSSRRAAKIRRQKIGFIFQSFNLLPRQHVIDNIILPMVYFGTSKIQREKRAHELLEQVGLTDRGYYMPSQLSGGQKQRVAVARALANNPSLILADEPTGNLDQETGQQIIDLLRELNKKGHTVIIVTHNEVIAKQAQRTIHIVDGELVSDKSQTNNYDFRTNRQAYRSNEPAAKILVESDQERTMPAIDAIEYQANIHEDFVAGTRDTELNVLQLAQVPAPIAPLVIHVDSDSENMAALPAAPTEIDDSIDRIAIPVHQTSSVAKKVRTYRKSKTVRELSRKNRRGVTTSTKKKNPATKKKNSTNKKKAIS
ncbi:ABC transporter ATP-binding protein [Candidatus Saccharibacteria bacterium]|nr:ABC transporter ATP-binding protein [Candidatus Saccharibacteria bacterium]